MMKKNVASYPERNPHCDYVPVTQSREIGKPRKLQPPNWYLKDITPEYEAGSGKHWTTAHHSAQACVAV